MRMMGYGDGVMGGNSGWSLFGGILALIFVLAAVAAVTLLVVWLIRRGPATPGAGLRGGQEAGEILRRRYASGDIDDEEFRRRLTALEGP